MKRSAIQTCSLAVVLLACTNVGADDDDKSAFAARPKSLQGSLTGKSWATLTPDLSGYRLRLLTDEEKNSVEKMVLSYRQARGQGAVAETLSAEYYAMPSDVRVGHFYRLRRLESGAIELKDDELHAILPPASVTAVLLGPKGTLGMADRFDRVAIARSVAPSTQSFAQALRGSGRGGFGNSKTDVSAGMVGAVVEATEKSGDPQQDLKPTVYFLKYAEANSVLDVIDRIYATFDIRVAIEPRLNAIIVQCEAKLAKQIEQLIEALDRQSVNGPEEPTEAPTLRAYSLDDSDATTVVQVLQTVLAGTPGVRLSVDIKANRLIVLGRTADHETVKATIKQLEWEE